MEGVKQKRTLKRWNKEILLKTPSLLAILGNGFAFSGLRLSLQWGFLFQLDDVSLRRRRWVFHRERRMPALLWKLSWQLSVSLQVFVCSTYIPFRCFYPMNLRTEPDTNKTQLTTRSALISMSAVKWHTIAIISVSTLKVLTNVNVTKVKVRADWWCYYIRRVWSHSHVTKVLF